jgi:uncharacterized protein (DUF2237 family)
MSLFALLLPLSTLAYRGAEVTTLDAHPRTNVYGKELQKCSGSGMAITGFTRRGLCEDSGDDDAGSHHICLDLKTEDTKNFCEVTGQPNWCDEQSACDADGAARCPIQNWCVCQWAFSSYLEKAGGCDKIQKVVCEATNEAALRAYRRDARKDTKIAAALRCLETRCSL